MEKQIRQSIDARNNNLVMNNNQDYSQVFDFIKDDKWMQQKSKKMVKSGLKNKSTLGT